MSNDEKNSPEIAAGGLTQEVIAKLTEENNSLRERNIQFAAKIEEYKERILRLSSERDAYFDALERLQEKLIYEVKNGR